MVGEQRKRKRWLQPPGYLDLSGYTVPGVVPPKGGDPSSLAQGVSAKPQAVLMDCTAVPPKDTRGQEALTQKLRLDF